jgi:hypothetical protein
VRAAVAALAALPEVDPDRIGAVGVCAGAGYMARAVADEPRIRAFGAVAGFYHDAAMQRQWMQGAFDAQVAAGRAARIKFEETGVADMIPAVGKQGDVAMPLDEAFAYYGTPRGAVANYTNGFAVMSREFTLPFDAQSAAAAITVPTLMIHSEKALAPPLARSFFAGWPGRSARSGSSRRDRSTSTIAPSGSSRPPIASPSTSGRRSRDAHRAGCRRAGAALFRRPPMVLALNRLRMPRTSFLARRAGALRVPVAGKHEQELHHLRLVPARVRRDEDLVGRHIVGAHTAPAARRAAAPRSPRRTRGRRTR